MLESQQLVKSCRDVVTAGSTDDVATLQKQLLDLQQAAMALIVKLGDAAPGRVRSPPAVAGIEQAEHLQT